MPVFTNYPTTQPMQLSDMLGDLNTLQQYKQQQQLMPLALEKAQLEIQKARETTNPEIERIKSLSRQQLGTEKPAITQQEEAAKQSQIETLNRQFAYDKDYNAQINQKLGGFLNDKRLKGSPSEVLSVLKDAENEVKLLTKSDPEHELKTEARFAPLKALTVSGKHTNVEQALKNIIQSGISPTSQQNLQAKQLTTVGGAPAVFNPLSGTAEPLTIGEQAPTAPQSMPQFIGQLQGGPLPPGMPAGMPQGVTPTQMSLQYPKRIAGDIRPYAPNEKTDEEKGAAYRNSLTTRQTDLATSKRNLDEVISQADKIAKESFKFGGLDTSTGTLGAVSRTWASIVGDPKYKQLSKDLANVQIANIQAQGGSMDTVAGQQLQRMANGDETYPPDVLKNIARRTYADVQNLDMQATAAAKFAQKYGDNNLNTFKRLWSSNADSKVFEAISIFETVKDKAERNKQINELFGNNPQAREQYFKKYNNIKKLTETGEL